MQSSIARIPLPFTDQFWPEIARRLLTKDAPEAQIVLVANQLQAKELRAAIAQTLVAERIAVVIAPTIHVLDTWVGTLREELGTVRTHTSRQIELYEALVATPWLVEASGGDAGGFWALSRQILVLCDQLTLSLGRPDEDGAAPDIERRLLAFIRGTYRDRAWDACSMEAALVAQVWQLTLSRQDGAAVLLRGLDRIARQAVAPLVAVECVQAPPHLESFLNLYAQRASVTRIQVDLSQTLVAASALAAAWPELLHADVYPDLRSRAQELSARGAALTNLAITGADSLEQEASCVCDQVLRWLKSGKSCIGLVALDRLVARRIRALLERSEVIVADEAGWKLSTTTVAGTLMRWLELALQGASRCESQVLLDWLKSPYALSALEDKTAVLAEFELAIRDANVVRGFDAMRAALARRGQRNPDDAVRIQRLKAAGAMLNDLNELIDAVRSTHTYAGHFRWLAQALTRTGMSVAFSTDAAGALLLEVIDGLAHDARDEASWQRVALRSWRDFVADALENNTFREAGVDSPVIATSLEGATLRRFDAVVFVGADTQHLPAKPREMLFLTPALGVELGLEDRAARINAELAAVAMLLASTPDALVTFQRGGAENEHALAGALERLSFVHRIAFGDDLKRSWQWPLSAIVPRMVKVPAPRAPTLIPARVSASGFNRMLSCPYRYFAQYVLRLEALEEVSEDVEKRDYGDLVHQSLEAFHDRLGELGSMGEKAMLALLRATTDAVFKQNNADQSAYLGYRARFEALLPSYVRWWRERANLGWSVDEMEAKHARALTLQDGRSLMLEGRLDRADRRGLEWAIVDYKTASRKALEDRMKQPGEDVQLPFYRLLLSDRQVTESFFLSLDTKEVARVDARENIDGLAQKVEQRIVNTFSALNAGAPMPAQGDDHACKWCDHRGLCRKGHWAEDEQNQGAR